MKEFKFYLREKIVKRVSVDSELAKSLIEDAEERFRKAEKLDMNEFSKFVFENIYDALREILDAILTLKGFKSYSHEASISFLKEFNIEESILLELDNFRYKRNSSKYYGKKIPVGSSKEIYHFYRKYAERLIRLCKKEDNCSENRTPD